MSEDRGNVIAFPTLQRPRMSFDKLRGRLGHFTITDEAIQLFPDLVLLIMAKCIVMSAGRCAHHGSTVYLAISEHFAQVCDAETPPMYEWVYEQGQGMVARRLVPNVHA